MRLSKNESIVHVNPIIIKQRHLSRYASHDRNCLKISKQSAKACITKLLKLVAASLAKKKLDSSINSVRILFMLINKILELDMCF